MSDGHTSSSPPAETLPRHTHYRTCLNAVPEDDKLVCPIFTHHLSFGYRLLKLNVFSDLTTIQDIIHESL